jgi:hypothetical protein
MAEPVAFVSHFAVKPGKGDGLARIFPESSTRLEEEKPRTLVFLAYFNETGTEVSFLHVFADAESMDLHFQGADERSRDAYEYLEPKGWELYGRPSQGSPGNAATSRFISRRDLERRARVRGRLPAPRVVVAAHR